ncbi:MAG: tetratricopeptide repeat protein, partial [Terriglobales bacterium]
VQVAPQLADAHHDYGLALAKVGRSKEALQEFKTALQLDPQLANSWLSMGGLYQSSGQIADAIEVYKQFITRFPHSADTPKIAALVEALQKEFPQAAVDRTANSTESADYYADVTRGGAIRWKASSMPIKVFIKDGSNVAGYQPVYDEILRRSFSDWSQASKGLVTFQFVTDPSKAHIECTWLADGKGLASQAESGETRLTLRGNYIQHATVKLLTIPLLPEMPMTPNRIRMITLHELGHALGFAGHTTDPRDAMFFSTNLEDVWKDLSVRDANTLLRLYDTPAPGSTTVTTTTTTTTPSPQ